MRVTASHKYSADIADLYAAFCKADFYKKKFAAVGARDIQILEKKKRGETFSISTQREVPSDVPGMLRKFVGEWNTIIQSESWEPDDDGYFNQIEIESEGVPASIEGTMSLQPAGNGCVNKLSFEIDCAIPLVGRKLENFIAKDMEKVLASEYKFIKSYVGS